MDALQSYEKRDTLCFEMTDGEIRLKHNHGYWFQVQGQLLVTVAKYCDFVIYTRQDINI